MTETRKDSDRKFIETIGNVLSESLEYEATIDKVVDLALGFLGDWCSLDLLAEDGSIQRVAMAHSNPDLLKRIQDYRSRRPGSVDPRFPVARVIQTGEAVYVPNLTEEMLATMNLSPEIREFVRDLDICSYVAAPLKARGRVIGVLSLIRNSASRRYDDQDLAFIKDVATHTALHIDNARLFRKAQLAQKESAQLAEITGLLAECFDSADILQRLAHSAVEGFSDYCIVHRFDIDGRLVRAAGAHTRPELSAVVDALLEQEVEPEGQDYIRSIIESGTPHLTTEGGQLASRMREGRYRDMILKLAPSSWIIAPLVARENRFGAIILVRSEKTPPYTQSDVRFVEELARRAAIAIDNERLYRESQEARRREARYKEAFENAADVIFITDLDGVISEVNRAAEAITGYAREELLGQHFTKIVAPEHLALMAQVRDQKFDGKTNTVYEMNVLTKQMARVPVEVNTRLIYENGRPIATQGIVRDLRERKHLEEELQRAQRIEAVGRLAGGIAHDFNNALTIIIGHAQFTLADLNLGSVRKSLESIKKAAEHAASLTRQLLAFSRKQVLQPQVLDLNEVISGMRDLLSRTIGDNIELITTLGAGLRFIKADPGKIEQVILNLVLNARDAIQGSGRLIIATADVEFSDHDVRGRPGAETGAYVMLSIHDTGHGMDEETTSHLFEPFFSTKEKGQGTGLGLATVYGIVKQSNGYIEVDSRIGEGTTFRIYLPVTSEKPSGQDAPQPAAKYGHETILVAEDDPGVREITISMLKGKGYQTIAASDGEEAVEICRQYEGPIHLLLTDVIMRRMAGGRLAELAVRIRPELTVLFMSGYTADIINRQGLGAAIHLIEKPFSPEQLLAKVQELLQGARAT